MTVCLNKPNSRHPVKIAKKTKNRKSHKRLSAPKSIPTVETSYIVPRGHRAYSCTAAGRQAGSTRRIERAVRERRKIHTPSAALASRARERMRCCRERERERERKRRVEGRLVPEQARARRTVSNRAAALSLFLAQSVVADRPAQSTVCIHTHTHIYIYARGSPLRVYTAFACLYIYTQTDSFAPRQCALRESALL